MFLICSSVSEPVSKLKYINLAFQAATEAAAQQQSLLDFVRPLEEEESPSEWEKTRIISRGASFIAVRPADLARVHGVDVSDQMGEGGMTRPSTLLSSSSAASAVTMAAAAASTYYYAVYGKSTGAGTSVAVTSNTLPGTGVPVVPEGGQYETSGGSPDMRVDHLLTIVRGLVPNTSYVFASALHRGTGDVVGGLGPTSAPVLAASPLPLHLLWSYVATEAIRFGAPSLARTAAFRVVRDFLREGPERPPWQRPASQTLSLRREEVLRTPRPVLQGLLRSFLILAETGAGGAGRGLSFPPLTVPNPGGLYDHGEEGGGGNGGGGGGGGAPGGGLAGDEAGGGSAGLSSLMSGVSREEGRSSAVESLVVSGGSAAVRAQAAALRRVKTLTLAVHIASVLRDPHLIQHAVCAFYSACRPLLRGQSVAPGLIQPLVEAHQAMQLLPPESWHWPATRAFSRIVFEFVRAAGGGSLSPTSANGSSVPAIISEASLRHFVLTRLAAPSAPRGGTWKKFKVADLSSRSNFFGLPGVGPWEREAIRPPHLSFLGRRAVYATDVPVEATGAVLNPGATIPGLGGTTSNLLSLSATASATDLTSATQEVGGRLTRVTSGYVDVYGSNAALSLLSVAGSVEEADLDFTLGLEQEAVAELLLSLNSSWAKSGETKENKSIRTAAGLVYETPQHEKKIKKEGEAEGGEAEGGGEEDL